MTRPSRKPTDTTLGEFVKRVRRKKGLTQEALAGSEFSKRFVAAIERGTFVPSTKAVEVLLRRLEVPATDMPSAHRSPETKPDLHALQEDLLYQVNFAMMLIRNYRPEEATALIDSIEESVRPYWDMLPGSVAYQLPYLRGRYYIQRLSPRKALPYLEEALLIAGDDQEACARTNNLLGVVYFELDQPWLALKYHHLCEQAILSKAIKDLTFHVNVYRNLANDYWATNQPELSIGIYRQVLLPLVQNINAPEDEARVFWGLSMAYTQIGDNVRAMGHAWKALDIYEYQAGNAYPSEAAAVCCYLAEGLVKSERYDEAQQVLERAERLMDGIDEPDTISYVHQWYATLALQQNLCEEATVHARMGVELARAYYESLQNEQNEAARTWQNPNRPYVQALHVQALIEDKLGHRQAASALFEQAIALLQPVGFEEISYSIHLSYAEKLESWRDFEKAAKHFKIAAQLQHRAVDRDI